MSKKMKWAYRALRAGDAAYAVIEMAPNAVIVSCIILMSLVLLGADPMFCLAAFGILSATLLAAAFAYLFSHIAIWALGFTEEDLEREALG